MCGCCFFRALSPAETCAVSKVLAAGRVWAADRRASGALVVRACSEITEVCLCLLVPLLRALVVRSSCPKEHWLARLQLLWYKIALCCGWRRSTLQCNVLTCCERRSLAVAVPCVPQCGWRAACVCRLKAANLRLMSHVP